MTTTFSSKSNAKRGAMKAGLDPSTLAFVENDGRWSWRSEDEQDVADAKAALAEADVKAPYPPANPTRKREAEKLAAKAKAKREPKPAKAPRQGQSKREIVADLLIRKQGTTRREILSATGWPAVSVPAVAKASGLKLRKEKGDDGKARYYGQPA